MAELVNQKNIEHLAHLAKLDLTEDEKNRFGNQLAQILDYMGDLQALKVGPHHVELINGVLDNVRPDEVRRRLSAEQALKNAPSFHGSYFKVKAIFE